MRCLVTGASGFVGSHLVRKLVGDGHDVLAVVRKSSDLWRLEDVEGKVRFAYASLSDIRSIGNEIRQFKPDAAFHLSWTGGNCRKFVNDPSQVFENVPGSLDLVRLCHEAECTRYLFLGTSVEYDNYRQPVRETDPAEPTNLYGLAKLTTLQLSQALCAGYGMRFVGVRLFWAYGPMDDGLRMVPSVTAKPLVRERPSLTHGEQLWDFLYIDDVVAALITAATNDAAEGIFNLGSGAPISIRDLVSQIGDAIDPDLELGFGEVPYAADQVMHLEADISRLRAATGWSPKIDLHEGIRRTVEFYARQGAAHAVKH